MKINLLIILVVISIGISIINLIKQNKIMAKQDQINASLAELNDATNSIAARIQALVDGQNPGDPVSQESLDQLQAIADNLKAMGTDPNQPIPPVA